MNTVDIGNPLQWRDSVPALSFMETRFAEETLASPSPAKKRVRETGDILEDAPNPTTYPPKPDALCSAVWGRDGQRLALLELGNWPGC